MGLIITEGNSDYRQNDMQKIMKDVGLKQDELNVKKASDCIPSMEPKFSTVENLTGNMSHPHTATETNSTVDENQRARDKTRLKDKEKALNDRKRDDYRRKDEKESSKKEDDRWRESEREKRRDERDRDRRRSPDRYVHSTKNLI